MSATRLALRPGLRTVRRDVGALQLGLDAPARALVADVPDVRRLLADLGVGAPLAGLPRAAGPARAALRALDDAGLLVDADALDRDRLGHASGVAEATYAARGDDATDVLARRGAARVALVAGRGVDLEPVTTLLTQAGMAVVATTSSPSVVLLVDSGPTPREHVDPWSSDGVAHLVLEAHDGELRLGPFVEPGRTACLRCVDAHAGEADPRRALVLEQLAAHPAPPPPADPVLLAWALAWAARDLMTHAGGERPSTWSATVVLGRADPVVVPWARHPHCGCAWDVMTR